MNSNEGREVDLEVTVSGGEREDEVELVAEVQKAVEEESAMEAIKLRVAGKVEKIKSMIAEMTGESDEERKGIR